MKVQIPNSSKGLRLFLCTPFIFVCLCPKAAAEIGKAAQNLGALSRGGKHRHPRECTISSNHRASALSLTHLHFPPYNLAPKHLLWEPYSCWLPLFAAAESQPWEGVLVSYQLLGFPAVNSQGSQESVSNDLSWIVHKHHLSSIAMSFSNLEYPGKDR